VRFQVFQKGKTAEDFSLSAAYMFGIDSIPLRSSSKIKCKNGMIECKRKSMDSAGLVLLWPIEGFGKILLPTTRLPERKDPYNLNIELARAKLMQITLKREDWSLFEETNSFAEFAQQAQELFIEALQNISDPAKASVLADESLRKSLIFSEMLAAKHGEIFFAARCRNRGLGRHSLGCQINPQFMENEQYQKRLFEMFGFATIPVSWAQIEPEKGEFNFSTMDRCIDLLSKKRLAICAGPLLRFSDDHLPQWLINSKPKFSKIRELAYDFAARVVNRYAKYIHLWRVISGMNVDNHFQFSFEQIIEMTRTATLASKSPEAKSKRLIEVLFPWGEYYTNEREVVPPMVYIDTVIQSGISFDGFAIQMNFGKDSPGMHIRDMMQISSKLDQFASVAKPLHITGVAVPDHSGSGPQDCKEAGFWHRQWDQQVQSEWIEQVYGIALGKLFVNSVTYSNLADTEELEILGSGLLTEELEPKKAFLSMAKLQKNILNK